MRESQSLKVMAAGARAAPTLADLAEFAGELVRHIDQEDFLPALAAGLGRMVDFDNFLVFRYQDRCAAELVCTNLDFGKLRKDMTPYIDGLYLLDPLYLASTTGRRRGLLHMEEVAPEAFEDSEYFRMFYKAVHVVDEVRFIVELNGLELIHVFLEREAPNARYTPEQIDTLRGLENLVEGFLAKHWEWRSMSASVHSAARAPLPFGVRSVIGNLKRKVLTAREIDIVELTIKGHSSKSIAHELGISEGTVINHKRNIYGKLDIGSQSQLFHLFLQALYGSNLEPSSAADAAPT